MESTAKFGNLWENAIERWKKAGWKVNPEPITENRPLWLKREDGTLGEIYMGFHDGHYYLEASYENDSNFFTVSEMEEWWPKKIWRLVGISTIML